MDSDISDGEEMAKVVNIDATAKVEGTPQKVRKVLASTEDDSKEAIGFDLHKYYCLQYIISITLYHMYFLKCFVPVSFDYFCSSLYYIVSS